MAEPINLNRPCFWEAIEALGQEKSYHVSWKDGELIIQRADRAVWRVGVIDEVKNAFVRLDVSIETEAGVTTFKKGGYYTPGLNADTAERVILNCVNEAFEIRDGSMKSDALILA